MDRLPLIDQFPYRFYAPRFNRLVNLVARPYNAIALLRREQKVLEIQLQGLENLRPLLGRGDGVLITPNHPDNADPAVMFEVSHRVGLPFHYLAAYQLFHGMARHVLPRIGAFPIDREGADLRAFKTGVEVLSRGKSPLVIFPEGEIYHVCDLLTPLREGAVAFATTAAKRIAGSGRKVWIVPTALKYRFLEHHDPMPALLEVMDRLEARFTWWPDSHRPLVERIYKYAEALLTLKELELVGQPRTGTLIERIVGLREAILDRIEDRLAGKRRVDCVPVRVKELRKLCLEALARTDLEPEDRAMIHRDLNDLFVAIQLFSYPGDYVRREPSLERVAETLLKFEQDTLGAHGACPRGPRRAIVRFGEPIEVGSRLAELGKSRVAIGKMTEELEGRIQGLLDAIGPGRPFVDLASTPSLMAPRIAMPTSGS